MVMEINWYTFDFIQHVLRPVDDMSLGRRTVYFSI